MRYRYRLSFSKTDIARFVGHLDLQSLFQRAFKRAKLPLAYSSGFNPHQLVSFAMPLPLGMAGLSEVVEVELTKAVSPAEIKSAVNSVLPKGLKINGARLMDESEKSAAALLARAGWLIIAPYGGTALKTAVADIRARTEIFVDVSGKKGVKREEIRTDIIDIYVDESNDRAVCALISAGGARNLKPAAICDLLREGGGENVQGFYKVSRAALFDGSGRML